MILYLAAIGDNPWKRLYVNILEMCPDIGALCTFVRPAEFEQYDLISNHQEIDVSEHEELF